MILFTIIITLLFILAVVIAVIQFMARVKFERILYQMLLKSHKALMIMKTLDNKGAFQAHDQVGQTFMLLTQVIQELRNYFVGKIGEAQKGESQE